MRFESPVENNTEQLDESVLLGCGGFSHLRRLHSKNLYESMGIDIAKTRHSARRAHHQHAVDDQLGSGERAKSGDGARLDHPCPECSVVAASLSLMPTMVPSRASVITVLVASLV